MYYVKRKLNNYDSVYGADDQSSFEQAFPVELYIKSVDGFGGDGDFMSKFGIEIRDRVVFSVAQRIFSEEVGTFTTQTRPFEGDLIYFPLNDKCFEIKYVKKFEVFYQLGALQTWELTCELFEYSNETFNTGIPAIDKIQNKYDTNILHRAIKLQDGGFILTEDEDYLILEASGVDDLLAAADNDEIQTEGEDFIDWTHKDPFSEGRL
jgi:hypothetical protein